MKPLRYWVGDGMWDKGTLLGKWFVYDRENPTEWAVLCRTRADARKECAKLNRRRRAA